MSSNKTLAIATDRLSQFDAADHELARKTLVAAMTATKTVRSRNGEGRICYVEQPDWAIRLPAAIKLIEFVNGRPVAMTVVANVSTGAPQQNQDDFFASLIRDKDAVAALRDTLENLASAAEKVQPVDITPALSDTEDLEA